MWPAFDPEVKRQLAQIREMVTRQHQVPTREWPVIFVAEEDALLVVREWPGGRLTAYTMSKGATPR